MKRNRYPGTRSFQEQDADIFFGREDDKKKLLQLIRLEQLLVLYGKSGLGKTSLLNAGVLPLLKNQAIQPQYAADGENETGSDEEAVPQGWHPLEVRFHAWHKQTTQNPSDTFRQEALGGQKLHPLLAKIKPGAEGWWFAFKSFQLENPGIFLLVFDQFEELFTYPASQVADFKRAFADLLHADMPSDFRKALREKLREDPKLLSPEERKQLYQPLSIKAILSIRSDRLSLLDQLADTLPNILVNLYELKPLEQQQARAAIVLPGKKEDAGFETPAFEYSPEALETILRHLSGEKGDIEPFQIQYICEHAEDIIRKQGKPVIEAADLGDLPGLFRRFYDNKIHSLSETTLKKKARRLLEDRLLFNGIRLSILREQITDPTGYDIPLPLLDQLENLRLLRAERRNDQVYYEITHDTLVDPILASKAEWLAEKRLAEEQLRNIEQEKALEAERLKRRKARWFAAGMGFLALVSVTALLFAVFQQQIAESAKRSAVEALLPIAEDHVLELQYEAALDKLKAAAGLQANEEAVAKGLLEIAFFHSESHNFRRATSILDTIARLLDKPDVMDAFEPYPADNLKVMNTFRQALYGLDSELFQSMVARYYPRMMLVQGDSFTMNSENYFGSQTQSRQINLNDFWMAETETTFWQYGLFCAAKGKEMEPPSWRISGDNPAVNVSWYDAEEYIAWINGQQLEEIFLLNEVRQNPNFKRFHLPSEAEWAYAAKGGNKSDSSYVYSGSNNLDEVGWYSGNSGNRTQPVKTKKQNNLGLYDLSGNTWEWCRDEWKRDLEGAPTDGSAWESGSGSSRVIRGGSWSFIAQHCRVSFRNHDYPVRRYYIIGFRLAHSY